MCACCVGLWVVGCQYEQDETPTVTEEAGIVYSVEWLGHGMDDLRFEFRQVKGIFLFPRTSRLGLKHNQLPVRWVPGFFLGVKQFGLEVYRAPLYMAQLKNDWICTSTPPVCLRGVERDKFIFCNGSSKMREMCLSFVRFCVLGLYRKKLRKLESQ